MKLYSLLVVCGMLVAAGLVVSGCERQVAERSGAELRQDERITALVTEALAGSPAYKFPDVQVSTYKGRVQLSGFVLTDEQKRAAEQLAKQVPDVVDIENRISIKD